MYPPKVMICIYVVMVSYRITSLKGLERFLHNHPMIASACGLGDQIPSYRTLGRRLETIDHPVQALAYQLVRVLVEKGVISLTVVATDASLLEAKGRKPHKGSRIIPTDQDATWGWADFSKWVFGYKFHLSSTVQLKGEIVPLAWRVTPANLHDSVAFEDLMGQVLTKADYCNRKVNFSLADKGYDYNDFYEFLEAREIFHFTPVRRFKNRTEHPLKERAKELAETPSGKSFYYRRGDVERLYGQLKDVYLLDPLPVTGLAKVRGYVSTICLSYLAGVLYNHLNGRSKRAIKSLTF